MIFGNKQCSIEHDNVFHPVTYQGKVKLEQLADPTQRLAFEVQISEFGQTPRQIFFKSHPKKFDTFEKVQTVEEDPLDKITLTEGANKLFSSLNEEIKEASMPQKDDANASLATVDSQNQPQAIQRSILKDFQGFSKKSVPNVHNKQITSVHFYMDKSSSSIL